MSNFKENECLGSQIEEIENEISTNYNLIVDGLQLNETVIVNEQNKSEKEFDLLTEYNKELNDVVAQKDVNPKELKAIDYKNSYSFDPYKVKREELEMADKLAIVFSYIKIGNDIFSESMENRLSFYRSLISQKKIHTFLQVVTDHDIFAVSENIDSCSKGGIKQLIAKGYIDAESDLKTLNLETVCLISISELYQIIQSELIYLNMFKNIDDKEFGILPVFFSGTCYKIDHDSFILSEVVQFISSKVIETELYVLFEKVLINKIKNSLDFNHIVSRQLCSNYQYIFDTVEEEKFDNISYEINTPKGILNLKTLKLRQRNINDYNLLCTFADFLPDYKDEPREFTNIIWDILSINQNSCGYTRTVTMNRKSYNEINCNRFNSFMGVYGYLLTGEVMDKILPIEVGDSNTGKSTRHKILKKILGSYAGDCTISSLIRSNRSKNDIRPEFIKLRRKRLVISAEPSERDILDEKILKALSGGDPLSFRKPHSGNVISFTAILKLLISSNYIPQIKPLDDKGFYNRLVMFETKGELTNDKMNPNYFQEMTCKDMADKIFTFLCGYSNDYYVNGGLFIDDTFKLSKDQFYLNQKDPVSLFFKTCIIYNEFSVARNFGIRIYVNELYKAFKAFLIRVNVDEVISRKKFSTRFQEIAECVGIERNDQDPKHGVYYDQFNINIYNNPELF